MKIKLKQDGTIKTVAIGRIKSVALIVVVADSDSQEVFVYYKDGGKRLVEAEDSLVAFGYPQILYCVDAGIDYLKPYLDKEVNTLDITNINQYTSVETKYEDYLRSRVTVYENETKPRF